MATITLPTPNTKNSLAAEYKCNYGSGDHYYIANTDTIVGNFFSVEILEDAVIDTLECIDPDGDGTTFVNYLTKANIPAQKQGYPPILCSTVFTKITLTSGVVRINR
ncbi:MAG: hypothetical protein IPO21_14365 [Bacteroidales bacterium]|nr:hypothetical protein [Bacteroidales bacterium]